MSETVNRLNEVSNEVLGYMDQLHVAASSKTTKSKKKLERALQNAKDEILKMTNKVLQFQQDLGMKDERLQQLTAQVDAKKVEITHLKRQQDMNKKTYGNIQEELKQERNALQLEVESLQMDITMLKNQLKDSKQESSALKDVNPKLQEIKDTALVELKRLKTKMDAEELDIPDVKKELAEQFQVQLQQMSDVYNEEMELWMQECRVHVHTILEVELSEDEAQQWTQDRIGQSQPTSALSNKDKPVSPYHTSSIVSDVKPSTAESEVRPSYEKSDSDADLMDETYWVNNCIYL
uniref:Protein Daple-like n=1 Tax=Phallusia mammillata TaxID=59560 RepID=A0A6F9D830_9ASCI|nr:protein Daple-like [Phallusia mammillata]